MRSILLQIKLFKLLGTGDSLKMQKKHYLSLMIFLGAFINQAAFAIGSGDPTEVGPPKSSEPSSTAMQTMAATTPNASSATLTQAMPQSAAISDSTSVDTPPPSPAISCDYTLPEAAATAPESVSSDTIIQWANYAATQTFTYDFRNYDKQFKQLQHCYTTAGWESFQNAMKASNNLKVAQDEQLFVTAKIDGQSQLVNQTTSGTQPTWLVRVPLVVTYQNQDREVTQDMYIDLTIKPTYGLPARLGINQIIASPKIVNGTKTSA